MLKSNAAMALESSRDATAPAAMPMRARRRVLAMTLRCTYWAPDVGREFDILVNGEKIATQTLPLIGKDGFSDEDYPIPTQLIQGKDKVTVKFQAHPGSTAGGVFGVLMMKP